MQVVINLFLFCQRYLALSTTAVGGGGGGSKVWERQQGSGGGGATDCVCIIHAEAISMYN